jgi:hypothetical protein
MTIATPPPRGVGTECELRALGISIKLRANAYLRNAPVPKNETPTTNANCHIVFKGQLPETAKTDSARTGTVISQLGAGYPGSDWLSTLIGRIQPSNS